jgi:hypothetical protein
MRGFCRSRGRSRWFSRWSRAPSAHRPTLAVVGPPAILLDQLAAARRAGVAWESAFPDALAVGRSMRSRHRRTPT